MNKINGSDARSTKFGFEPESIPATKNKKNTGIKKFFQNIFRRHSSSGKSAPSTEANLQKRAENIKNAPSEAKQQVNEKLLLTNNIRSPREKINRSQESSPPSYIPSPPPNDIDSPAPSYIPRPPKPSTEDLRQSIISSAAELLAGASTDARRQSSNMTANEKIFNDFEISLNKIFPKNELPVDGNMAENNNSIKKNPDISHQNSHHKFLQLLKTVYDRLPDTHKAEFYWIAVKSNLSDDFRIFKTPLEALNYENESEPAVTDSHFVKGKTSDYNNSTKNAAAEKDINNLDIDSKIKELDQIQSDLDSISNSNISQKGTEGTPLATKSKDANTEPGINSLDEILLALTELINEPQKKV